MTLPIALERLAGQLRDATQQRARRRARQRRLQVAGISLALLALIGSAALAGGWLGGTPAPDPVKRALVKEVAAMTPQVRALFGVPIPSEAIVGASLDAKRFVWGAPTTTGGYCIGLTGPGGGVDGDGCTTASGGGWGSYYDCDGGVILGGRIAGVERARTRVLTIWHDGRTLNVAVDPGRHGFFIARLPGAFFRDVGQHDRGTWPYYALLDARGRIVPPVRTSTGRFGPPDHRNCPSR